MTKNKHLLPILVAVWQAFSFVLMGVWVRMMNQSFTPYQQMFWRFLLAAIIAWLIFGNKFSKQTFRKLTGKDWFVYILRAFLNYGVGVLLFTFAVLHTELATVSFVSSLPIMGLLAWLMFREKLDPKALPFILLSIVGLAMVSGISFTNLAIGFGVTAAIISTLGFDISYLMVRYHRKEMSNFHNTTLMLSFAWLAPLILLLANKESFLPSTINSVALIGLAASIAFNIVGLYLLNYIFSNLKAYVAGNILLLEGVFAIVVGYFFYGEKLTYAALVGAVIITISALYISRISLKQEKSLEGEL